MTDDLQAFVNDPEKVSQFLKWAEGIPRGDESSSWYAERRMADQFLAILAHVQGQHSAQGWERAREIEALEVKLSAQSRTLTEIGQALSLGPNAAPPQILDGAQAIVTALLDQSQRRDAAEKAAKEAGRTLAQVQALADKWELEAENPGRFSTVKAVGKHYAAALRETMKGQRK